MLTDQRLSQCFAKETNLRVILKYLLHRFSSTTFFSQELQLGGSHSQRSIASEVVAANDDILSSLSLLFEVLDELPLVNRSCLLFSGEA
jgi:hypothetical protein